ncbi:MAG: RecQ family ATP-dependent DNA helicase [Burkholderiales bacterium]|nr:RecQ family ATP-dependent DNA helicase [Burkholderiales bacterium]
MTIIFNSVRALELLRIATNNSEANFRENQNIAIQTIVEGGRLLVVQKTGWGKSFVYFIATKLLREQGCGVALLVSPLLALMRNQLEAAKSMGVSAVVINSDNRDDRDTLYGQIKNNSVDIVLISPEQLSNEWFVSNVLSHIAESLSMLVIDEAHCISDWGHDFRPDYRKIQSILKRLPSNTRVLATTATANDRVISDLKIIFSGDLDIIRGDLSRNSLKLQTIKLNTPEERLAWLAKNIPPLSGSGIVYALTQKDAEMVASWLQTQNISAKPYHAGLTKEDKLIYEDELKDNQIKALVATTALGMGYDKPDIGFVIHYQMPNSVVSYYQQVGRAGRAIDFAYGILLSGAEDTNIIDYFINNAFPSRELVAQILEEFDKASDGLSLTELQAKVNIKKGKLEQVLKILSLEEPTPIVKDGSKYRLTITTLPESFWNKVKRLMQLRYAEVQEMQEYVKLQSGHMQFLIEALNGDASNYIESALPEVENTISTEMIANAQQFLFSNWLTIEPRKKFMQKLEIYDVGGNIRPELQLQQGKVLSAWNDAGWGRLVSSGKYQDKYFADKLIVASAKLISEWNIEFDCVVPIPSLRHPNLVSDFAERLAKELGKQFKPIIQITELRPEQKTMQNSIKQSLNLDGSFELTETPPQGCILLVDDMVDSRWTLTIAGWLLQKNGSGKVYPFALSKVGSGD